ncbi:hypothetical protein ACFLZR_01185, partial [Candidatus Neomarinimicrobiota bacterium]
RASSALSSVLPEGMEVLPPNMTVDPVIGNVIGGSARIQYVILPRVAGEFNIPSIEVHHFNPKSERFEIAETGSFHLNVNPRENMQPALTGLSRREVELMSDDIRFVKLNTPRWRKSGENWYTLDLFLLNLATMLIFATPWANERIQTLVATFRPGIHKRRATSAAISIIRKAQGDPAFIYARFSRAVTVFLNHKLGSNHHEYTIREVNKILSGEGVEQHDLEVIVRTLERAEEARFAAVGTGDIELDRESLRKTIISMDKRWTT